MVIWEHLSVQWNPCNTQSFNPLTICSSNCMKTFTFTWSFTYTLSLPQAHATKPLHLDRSHESVQEWLTDGYNSVGRQVWLVVSIYISIYQAWMNSQKMCKVTSNTYKLACIWRQKARVSDQQRPLAKPEWMAQKRAMLSKRAYPTN